MDSATQEKGIAKRLSALVKKPSHCVTAIAVSLLLSAASLPTVAKADSPADFVIPYGRFYTQANGFPPQTSLKGYAITDEDGILFWTEFRDLGGVAVLGYPTSQRLTYNDRVIQLTQRVVLMHDSNAGSVQLMDVFDLMSDAGLDHWLRQHWGIPPRADAKSLGMTLGTPRESGRLIRLLDQSPRLRDYYKGNGRLAALLGLPTSDLHQSGQYDVMRFQRGALQMWKVDTSWARAGDITMVNAGDALKQSGLLPPAALAPQEPPETVVRRAAASNRGQHGVRGLATWYGADFQGLEMRNGEMYDMYDPTTTASNIFPLESRLLVSSLHNGNSVEVRVTDTGAFRHPIIVDLSWAAFSKLADPAYGVIEVIVEPLDSN